MINKAVALGMSLCILLTGCGVSEETTESNSNTVEPRQITLKKSEMTPILLDDSIAATTNDVGNILNELDSEGYSSQSIKQSAGILDTEGNNEVKLTRYQVAAIASNMIEQQSATPDMTWYQIDYTDNSEIPDNYVQDICIVDKAGVMQYDDEFNGYSNISKEELQSIIDKTLEFISTAPKNQNQNNSDEEDTEIGIGVGEEIHREVYEDKLNGASVAVVKEPKTTGELNLNIESVSKVKLDNLIDSLITPERTLDKQADKVDIEYINMDEAFVDYSLIPNKEVKDLVGVTISEPYAFTTSVNYAGELLFGGSILVEKKFGTFLDAYTTILVKDNKVIEVGWYLRDTAGSNLILFETDQKNTEYDYVGIVCYKDYVEGHANEFPRNKVIVLIPKGEFRK